MQTYNSSDIPKKPGVKYKYCWFIGFWFAHYDLLFVLLLTLIIIIVHSYRYEWIIRKISPTFFDKRNWKQEKKGPLSFPSVDEIFGWRVTSRGRISTVFFFGYHSLSISTCQGKGQARIKKRKESFWFSTFHAIFFQIYLLFIIFLFQFSLIMYNCHYFDLLIPQCDEPGKNQLQHSCYLKYKDCRFLKIG